LPIRGGNWNNGANAGVFNLNLNNPRSNVNTNIGRRSALPRPLLYVLRHYGTAPAPGKRGALTVAGRQPAKILNCRKSC
jgi:hypothetical protein